MPEDLLALYGLAAKTAPGFFWKAGWAFVLGCFVSSMIQPFVPKGRLALYLGKPGPGRLSLAAFVATGGSFS